MATLYRILADAILILHVLIVFFVVGALPVIWIGHFCRWRFVRSFGFRMTHLALIGFVAAQSVAGALCPLTTWESRLRIKAGGDPYGDTGFIAHWFQRLLFYECDAWIFRASYVAFFLLVLATFLFIRPRPPRWWTNRKE